MIREIVDDNESTFWSLCDIGQKIEAEVNCVVIALGGEPTKLFYHLQTCDNCWRDWRSHANTESKKEDGDALS